MTSAPIEQIERIVVPLLRSLDALGFIARRLNPPELAGVLLQVDQPDADLRNPRYRHRHLAGTDRTAVYAL